MVNETRDIGTKKQVVIVLRWVDNKVNEDFIGVYLANSTTSYSLVTYSLCPALDEPEP